MKKISLSILSALALVALASCGNKEEAKTNNSTATTTAATTTATTTTVATTTVPATTTAADVVTTVTLGDEVNDVEFSYYEYGEEKTMSINKNDDALDTISKLIGNRSIVNYTQTHVDYEDNINTHVSGYDVFSSSDVDYTTKSNTKYSSDGYIKYGNGSSERFESTYKKVTNTAADNSVSTSESNKTIYLNYESDTEYELGYRYESGTADNYLYDKNCTYAKGYTTTTTGTNSSGQEVPFLPSFYGTMASEANLMSNQYNNTPVIEFDLNSDNKIYKEEFVTAGVVELSFQLTSNYIVVNIKNHFNSAKLDDYNAYLSVDEAIEAMEADTAYTNYEMWIDYKNPVDQASALKTNSLFTYSYFKLEAEQEIVNTSTSSTIENYELVEKTKTTTTKEKVTYEAKNTPLDLSYKNTFLNNCKENNQLDNFTWEK